MQQLQTITGLDAVTGQRAAAMLSDAEYSAQEATAFLAGVLLGMADPGMPTADEAVVWCESKGFLREGESGQIWDGYFDLDHEEGFLWLTFPKRPDRDVLATVKKYGFKAQYEKREEHTEDVRGSLRRRDCGRSTRAKRATFLGWRLELATVDVGFDVAELDNEDGAPAPAWGQTWPGSGPDPATASPSISF